MHDLGGLAGSVLELIEAAVPPAAMARHVEYEAPTSWDAREVSLHSPIPLPRRNIFCLGVNYAEHAEEVGATPRPTPVWFSKATTSVCGPYDDIVVEAALGRSLDWEAELAVVVGTGGRAIPLETALTHVHSYAVMNDITARDLQAERGGQWFLGKSVDRTAPFGPWLVLPADLPAGGLTITCTVNGVTKQRSTTRNMITGVAAAISDLSRVVTLLPGDIIATGTPAGVGVGREPREFLRDGDVVVTEVAGIGSLRNRVRINDGGLR